MNVKGLIEQKNSLLDEMDEMTKKLGEGEEMRAFTEEEQAKFDELVQRAEGIEKTIASLDKSMGMEKGGKSASDDEKENRAMEERDALLAFLKGEERAASSLDVANNGAVIPKTIADKIIEKVKELSPIYSMATVYDVGGDLVFPVYDESSDTGAALVEDMTELTESAGKFTSIKLEDYIVGVLKLISKSLVNRSDFDLVGFVIKKAAEDIAAFLENALLNGAASKYEGVFTTTNLVTAASATAITADELIDVQMTVPEVFQKNACWIMNKATFKTLRKLKDSDGNYLLNKDLTGGFGWALLGKPVYISENAPAIAAGKTAVVYGDMSGLYVKLAQNMEIEVLREKYATKHAIGVVGYVEFDAKIVEPQKLAGLKMKAS